MQKIQKKKFIDFFVTRTFLNLGTNMSLESEETMQQALMHTDTTKLNIRKAEFIGNYKLKLSDSTTLDLRDTKYHRVNVWQYEFCPNVFAVHFEPRMPSRYHRCKYFVVGDGNAPMLMKRK